MLYINTYNNGYTSDTKNNFIILHYFSSKVSWISEGSAQSRYLNNKTIIITMTAQHGFVHPLIKIQHSKDRMFLRCCLSSITRKKGTALLRWVHYIKVMWLRLVLSNWCKWLSIIPHLLPENRAWSALQNIKLSYQITSWFDKTTYKIWLKKYNAAAVPA